MDYKNRIQYIDIARGLGLILLVAGHLFTLQESTSNIIYSFHMPLFFLLSGLCIKKEALTASFKNYFILTVKKCLFPWLVYFVIALFISIIIPSWRSNITSINLILTFYLLQPDAFHIGQIWFLACLFWVKLLFYPIYHFVLKKHNVFFTILTLFGQFAFAINLMKLWSPFCELVIPFKIGSSTMALFFYSLGFLLAPILEEFNRNNTLKSKIIIAAFLFVTTLYLGSINGTVNLCEMVYNDTGLYLLSSTIGSLAIIILAMIISKKEKFISYIGQNSIHFFAFHSYAIYVYASILSLYHHNTVIAMKNISNLEAFIGTILITLLMGGLIYVIKTIMVCSINRQ